MNYNALLEYINQTPLTWLVVTLLSYKLGIIIYEKFNKHTLLQPIITSYIIILSLIVYTNTSFEEYFKSVEIIHFFLGPATVALALPLYNNLKHLKASWSIMGFRSRTSYNFINDNKINNSTNCSNYF